MTGLSKNIVIRPGPAKLVLTGFAPRVQIRQYLTMEHVWTARHAAAGQTSPPCGPAATRTASVNYGKLTDRGG